MSTSVRYDSIVTRLTVALLDLCPCVRDPLAWVLVGMNQTVSAQIVADAMPLRTDQASTIQRGRRLLDNATLTEGGLSALRCRFFTFL